MFKKIFSTVKVFKFTLNNYILNVFASLSILLLYTILCCLSQVLFLLYA